MFKGYGMFWAVFCCGIGALLVLFCVGYKLAAG